MSFEFKPAYESDYLEIIEVWEASVPYSAHGVIESKMTIFT